HARPQDWDVGVTRRSMRQHADDLPAGPLFSIADRRRNRLVIVLAQLHHQLPDAPPPPDEPPPPEKPLSEEELLLDESLPPLLLQLEDELHDELLSRTKTFFPCRVT